MGFWTKFFGSDEEGKSALVEVHEGPEVSYDHVPHILDLGWYDSEGKDEFQMAKIAERDRATHCYVIGVTGTGKTKFLEFLIQQDIRSGNGFGVIDPHGDLIEDIKGFRAIYYLVSEGQTEDAASRVVLIDPTDPNFTVTFNPIEALPNVSTTEQVNELIAAFRKIWSDSWGVRMEDLMRSTLIALGEAGLTLLEASPFLTDRSLRRAILSKVAHPVAKDYFRRGAGIQSRAGEAGVSGGTVTGREKRSRIHFPASRKVRDSDIQAVVPLRL
jgi:hypothetical protein